MRSLITMVVSLITAVVLMLNVVTADASAATSVEPQNMQPETGVAANGAFFWTEISNIGISSCRRTLIARQPNAEMVLTSIEVLPAPNSYVVHCLEKSTNTKLDLPFTVDHEGYPFVTVHPEAITTGDDPEDRAVANRLCRAVDKDFGSRTVDEVTTNHFQIRCVRQKEAENIYDQSFVMFILPVVRKIQDRVSRMESLEH